MDLAETPSATPLASLNGGGDWVAWGDGVWYESRVSRETRRRRREMRMVAVVKLRDFRGSGGERWWSGKGV